VNSSENLLNVFTLPDMRQQVRWGPYLVSNYQSVFCSMLDSFHDAKLFIRKMKDEDEDEIC